MRERALRWAVTLAPVLGLAGSGCKSAGGPAPAAAPAAAAPTTAAAETVPPQMRQPPPLPAPKTFVPAAPTIWKLPNGLEVVLLERHTVPVVSLELVLRTGSDADPSAKAGLAELCADLLDEGAGGKSALELAQAVERLGAQLETGAGVESSFVTLNVLRSRLDQAAALMADVVLRPNLDAKEFDRIKGEHLAALMQRRVQPRAIAQVALDAALYGDGAYGRPPQGFVATVEALALKDARSYYSTYYHPNNAVLVAAGDITPAELRTRVEKLFGHWKPRKLALPRPATPPERRPRVVLVDKPGAPQTVVRIGEPALPRASTDFAALETVTMVLGGSFTSRLDRNLRERNNFTYGAGAFLVWRRGTGPLVAQADVFTEVTAPALAEFMKELQAIRKDVSAEELAKVKALQRHGLVERMQSTQGLVSLVGQLVAAGLPADEYRKLDEELERLTLADLRRAADRYLHPDHATIVLVGDLAKIRPSIEKLGLGAVEMRDPEGRRL